MHEVQLATRAITGREEIADLSRPEQALAQFYHAFNSRDITLIAENWDTSGQPVMDNPLGGIMRGWHEIRRGYERLFAGPVRVEVEFCDYSLHLYDDIFWAIGRERGQAEGGGHQLPVEIRTTRVFHLRNGRWRQVHHHGSFDDPALLAAYQQAVR